MRRYLLILISGIVTSVLGCHGDRTVSPADRSSSYWALQINQHAINLALQSPYDTARLIVTPVTLTGVPLSEKSQTTFQASDSTVTVDSTGLLTAHFATTAGPSQITVAVAAQGVTLIDTIFVQVSEALPAAPLAEFSIHPPIGDSAKRAIDIIQSNGLTWPVTATDSLHNTLCDASGCSLQVYYTSSDPAVATIDRRSGVVIANDTGHVVFTVTTLVYGVAKRDSVVFTVGFRINYVMGLQLLKSSATPLLGFNAPSVLILGVGAVVTFWDQTPDPVDIIFDHPESVDSATCGIFFVIPPDGGGNIVPFGGDTTRVIPPIPFSSLNDFRCRRFPTPGTFRYHSSILPSDTFELDIKPQQ